MFELKIRKLLLPLFLIIFLILTRAFWYPPLRLGWELTKYIASEVMNESEVSEESVEELPLIEPKEQTFSIANVELGMTRSEVEAMHGDPQRESQNEYNVTWTTYHENYHNFFMVAYDNNNNVHGLYTNQELISSKNDLALGSPQTSVLDKLGSPLTSIRKGLVNYLIQDNGEFHVFSIDNTFLTVFYDLHEEKRVTAIQIISEELELAHNELYTPASSDLTEGFKWQLYDLTNATRYKHNLSILSWSEIAAATGLKHSQDMAENNYFDHNNLAGESPFDRMNQDQISYRLAAENLAYGQTSSIFAHQGLLNSEGHRKNILHPDFELLGIGVSFNQENQPYFTELFYQE